MQHAKERAIVRNGVYKIGGSEYGDDLVLLRACEKELGKGNFTIGRIVPDHDTVEAPLDIIETEEGQAI